MSCAAFVLTHLAFASLFAAVAVALGRRLAALAGPAARAERWGLPLALGLGAIGCATALLAAAGRLTGPWLGLVLAAAVAAAAPEWLALLAAVASLARRSRQRRAAAPLARLAPLAPLAPRIPRAPLARLAPIGALVAAAPVVVLSLYPPTGFDALLYHLPAAARMVASGRLAVAPELRFPVFPRLSECLAAAAMLLQDDVAAQLLECVAYLGVAALLWEMGRRRVGPWAGVLGAALWLGSPLAAWAAASSYVEPLEALFVLAAVEALLLAAGTPGSPAGRLIIAGTTGSPAGGSTIAGITGRSQATAERRALVLAGALAGCAAAVKYQGLLAVAVVAMAVWGCRGNRAQGAQGAQGEWGDAGDQSRARRWRTLLPPLAAAAAVALPWYLWVAVVTGDPLYPVLTSFGHPRPAGVPGLTNWRSLPWHVVAQKIWPYPPGSPWLLAPLPLLGWRRFPLAGRLGAAGLALALGTAAVRPDGRMLSVAAPLFAGGIAAVLVPWSLARWGAAGAAPRLLAMTLLALLPGWCYGALLAARRGGIPHDAAGRESYLRRQLPGYAALSWLNAAHGRQCAVYGLWAENLRYYAAGRFTGDWYGPSPFAAARCAAERPADLRAFLLAAGADHLLVRRQPGEPDLLVCGDARLAPFLRAERCDGEASIWAVVPPRRGGGA
jgi:hypothetical protein